MNIMTFSLPESPSFVIINVGDASVINIQNPSIHGIPKEKSLVDISQDYLHNQVQVPVVLAIDHVSLNISGTLRWNCWPCNHIVCLHCQSPTQTKANCTPLITRTRGLFAPAFIMTSCYAHCLCLWCQQ